MLTNTLNKNGVRQIEVFYTNPLSYYVYNSYVTYVKHRMLHVIRDADEILALIHFRLATPSTYRAFCCRCLK